jgi:hypothetical protein
VQLAISAAQRQITAGDGVRITAAASRGGHPVAGVSLSLAERAAGQATWQLVGQATTGTAGRAVLEIASLTANASFRVTGPGHATSGELTIVVIPAVTVSVDSGAHGKSEMLVVSAPLAQPGDVVELESLAGGQWQVLHTHLLRPGTQTTFAVVPRKISVTYRVVLVATAEHGQSVSGSITVAGRPGKGGQGERG